MQWGGSGAHCRGLNARSCGTIVFCSPSTRRQESGEHWIFFRKGRRALDDGPWMISKELLVVADFDGSKSLDEIDFSSIPSRIRVARLPVGLMTRSTTQVIGDEVGTFMEVDFESDDVAAGRFLRVKVRLDIHKPLQRSVTVDVGDSCGGRWCPMSYEFLPDFTGNS
jgi:hypothetical protein